MSGNEIEARLAVAIANLEFRREEYARLTALEQRARDKIRRLEADAPDCPKRNHYIAALRWLLQEHGPI